MGSHRWPWGLGAGLHGSVSSSQYYYLVGVSVDQSTNQSINQSVWAALFLVSSSILL